jgi:hypothetical protein
MIFNAILFKSLLAFNKILQGQRFIVLRIGSHETYQNHYKNQTNIPCECYFSDEEIGLLLDTTAAHHFNFVLPNMDQGVYEIKAVFITGAGVEIDICDDGEACSYDPDGTVEARAYAKAIINNTMLTVQQVRAAKDGLNEMEIIEP